MLTKRDMQNMHSGGARGLELRTAGLMDRALDLKPEVTQGCGLNLFRAKELPGIVKFSEP